MITRLLRWFNDRALQRSWNSPAGCCWCGSQMRGTRYGVWMDTDTDPDNAEPCCRTCLQSYPDGSTWPADIVVADAGVVHTVGEFIEGCRLMFDTRRPVTEVLA